jgi:hypothetical protein
MGRPLKIAKAQTVITLTATVASTSRITVSSTANVTAGMPFVIATTTGGLTAGTTYYVLTVVDGTRITASTIPIDANVTSTPATLTDAGPVTVAMTVFPVDTYFDNPVGVSNTYGVVGGNTAIYGQQIAANVAIGVAGAGTIYSTASSDVVSGVGTDFASTLAVGSWIGSDASTQSGYVATINGIITVTTASSDSVTDRITVDDSTGLAVGGAIVFAAAIGGLAAGTVYFVQALPTGTTLTVSLTQGGALLPLSTDTVVTTGTQDAVVLVANSAIAMSDSAWYYSTVETGYIIRQKGKTKYLVKGSTSGLIAPCYTANLSNAALTPNTMNIVATKVDTSTVRVKTVNDYWASDFSDNKYVASFNGAATAPAGTLYPIVDIASS